MGQVSWPVFLLFALLGSIIGWNACGVYELTRTEIKKKSGFLAISQSRGQGFDVSNFS
jgi:hypothetical protein